MLKIFRIFLNILDFFDFFEVFRTKLLNPMRPKHVFYIIRIAKKFHIGLSICGHWASLSKNGLIPKTAQKWDSTWVKLRRFTQNHINLDQKVSQNHRTVMNSNKANIYEKPPTHMSATYAITNFYHTSSNRIPRESAQNFYIIRFSISYWVRKPILIPKNLIRVKISSSEFSLTMPKSPSGC